MKITMNREKEIRSKTDDPKRHISQNGICAFSLSINLSREERKIKMTSGFPGMYRES